MYFFISCKIWNSGYRIEFLVAMELQTPCWKHESLTDATRKWIWTWTKIKKHTVSKYTVNARASPNLTKDNSCDTSMNMWTLINTRLPNQNVSLLNFTIWNARWVGNWVILKEEHFRILQGHSVKIRFWGQLVVRIDSNLKKIIQTKQSRLSHSLLQGSKGAFNEKTPELKTLYLCN